MNSALLTPDDEAAVVQKVRESRRQIQAELAKVIVGQDDVIEQLLICLVAGGHCLITGAPGLAKTLLVRSVAQIFHLKFQRIQFTPDLMPADIIGTEILEEDEHGSDICSLSKDRSLPMSYWPMKSIERHPRPRLRCWKRCKSIKSPRRKTL